MVCLSTAVRRFAPLLWCALVAQASTYTVVDLGTLGSVSGSDGYGINNSGQVTGEAVGAFLYSNGVMTALGANSIAGYGINDSGQVTGVANTGVVLDAFLYSNGVLLNLPNLVGGILSGVGYGINNSGQVTGVADTGVVGPNGFISDAFLYSNGVMTDLGSLGGVYGSAGYGINDSGDVTGISDTAGGYAHAFLYSNGVMSDLGVTPGGLDSYGMGINNSEQVTGYARTDTNFEGNPIIHAFLYSNGVMSDLGTLGIRTSTFGLGINSSGQVVGYAYPTPPPATIGPYDMHAFLYSNGVMTDLNSLILPTSGWTLVEATGINDVGQITGFGTTNGGTLGHSPVHAFRLDPPAVLPPSQVATTASGLAYSRVTQTFNGTVTITNIGSAAIAGPLQVLFSGLPTNVTLMNATGNFSSRLPYLAVPAPAGLAPGQSVSVTVQLRNPSNATINFSPVIYSGSIN
jgi:probable HAF family extracellular repeat protein